MTPHCPEAITVGAFLLDGLSEPEHADFLRHLDICRTCRGEVADLLPVVLQLDAIKSRVSATRPGPQPNNLRRRYVVDRW